MPERANGVTFSPEEALKYRDTMDEIARVVHHILHTAQFEGKFPRFVVTVGFNVPQHGSASALVLSHGNLPRLDDAIELLNCAVINLREHGVVESQ